MNGLIYHGDAAKALDDSGGVGGYLVRFSDPANPRRDLSGEFFTSKSYLGSRDGDGVDTLFHHGQPIPLRSGVPSAIAKEISALRDRTFAPIKASRDAVGIFVETILRLSDAYEAAIFGLVRAGKLGWSSGSTSHLTRITSDGEILRWPISEASLTFSPAEPLNKVLTIDSMRAEAAAPGKFTEKDRARIEELRRKYAPGKFRSEADRKRYEELRRKYQTPQLSPEMARIYARNQTRRRLFQLGHYDPS
jgi:hypothetical protein